MNLEKPKRLTIWNEESIFKTKEVDKLWCCIQLDGAMEAKLDITVSIITNILWTVNQNTSITIVLGKTTYYHVI
jgi:hypothetical protein